MFAGSRRHRPRAQPLTKETANPNAATAAASAFMRREPSTSLSSAAAAAAIRARPTTPTNVAEVQTKRTARRSPSLSSMGSRDRGRPSVVRSPSVGSMSERSFRSPSPGRGPAPQQQYIPPVPKLPSDGRIAQPTKAAGASSGRKPSTLQTQPFRTASQRQKDGQSGSWFGAAAAANDLSNVRKSDAVLQTSFDPNEARAGSISPSINFSYPRARSASIDSHNTPSPVAENNMVYDPNSRRMVPRVDLSERQYSIREVAEKPTKKKKKKAQDLSRSGSHLSKGTVGRTKAPVLEATQANAPRDAQRPVIDTDSEPPEYASDAEPFAAHSTPKASQNGGFIPEAAPEPQKPRPRESEANGSVHAPAPALTPIDTSMGTAGEDVQDLRDTQMSYARDTTKAPVQPVMDEERQPQRAHVEDATEVDDQTNEMPESAVAKHPSTIRRERVHSESPARTAHFASAADQLYVRHEPPSRSLSPRKSAMKQRSPTRGISPSEDGSEAGSARHRDETPVGRKKSVRVSFDQNTVVVGEAVSALAETDSPIVPSPQMSKKPWHSIVSRQNKKDQASLEEDETMSPRPALPLFGSVREKKVKEPEERPLVRPAERDWSPSPASPAPPQPNPLTSPVTKPSQADSSAEQSSQADQLAKHEANTSRYREPLPPVVTSVEGSGYNSPSSSEDEDEYDVAGYSPTVPHQNAAPDTAVESTVADSEADPAKTSQPQATSNGTALPVDSSKANLETGVPAVPAERQAIPDISISQASPHVHETPQSGATPQQEYFDVPGGFPEEEEDHVVAKPIPPPITTSKQAPLLANDNDNIPAPGSPMGDIEEEEEEASDGDSIYSDAYEDLEDVDGDGFMSLDAVVTAPVAKKSPPRKHAKHKPHVTVQTSVPPVKEKSSAETSHHSPDEWENAKAYWRSLSTEKRRQLEVEAMRDLEQEEGQVESGPKVKTKVLQKIANEGVAEASNGHARSYQIKPGTKWPSESDTNTNTNTNAQAKGSMKLRKSMRHQEPVLHDGPIHQGSMRMSMRSGGGGSTAASNYARTSAATGSPSKPSARPLSHQPRSTTELPNGHKRAQTFESKFSQSDPFTGPAIKPSPRRRGSDTSESSFTRSRPNGDGFGFKKSMRSSMYEPTTAKPAPEQTKGSGRFSLRSLSPTGSTFRRGSMTSASPGRMRHSLRADSNEASSSRVRIPTFSKATGKKAKSRLSSSRFGDSSDEEDGRNAFSSRFADSSDEDDFRSVQSKSQGRSKTMRNNMSSASAAAAAMGAPARQRQETESPDLPDSDDEDVPPPRQQVANGTTNGKANGSLHRSGSGRGNIGGSHHSAAAILDAAPARPAQKRRGSFMSAILGRKKGQTGKIAKGTGESAARRDTPLERSTDELSMIRTGSNNSRPRLQKRQPSWPFPDEPGVGTASSKDRPSTATGPTQTKPQTDYAARRSSSYNGPVSASALADDVAAPPSEANTGTPKKKKFGTLRKMFRLGD